MIWDFAGEPLPGPVLDDLRRVADHEIDELGGLLNRRERDAVAERLASLIDEGCLPEPRRRAGAGRPTPGPSSEPRSDRP